MISLYDAVKYKSVSLLLMATLWQNLLSANSRLRLNYYAGIFRLWTPRSGC